MRCREHPDADAGLQFGQRASVGWKAHKTAERLVEQYMVRIESCSARYSGTAEAN